MQVEILPGKELTNPPEVSFGLLMVTLAAKRKQWDSRDSYRAPKYQFTRRAMLLPEQKPTCGFIDMVRFHTLLRCRRTIHAIQGFQVNRGEPVSSTSSVRFGMPNNQKGRMANVIQVVGCPNSTSEAIERLWREVERKLLSSQLWHTKQYQKGNIIYTQR